MLATALDDPLEDGPHQALRLQAIELWNSLGSRSGRNPVLDHALLLFYGPLGIEPNPDRDHTGYVFYDAVSVAEGARSWPYFVNGQFNPVLPKKYEVAYDLMKPIADAVNARQASVTVREDGGLSVDIPDPTRSFAVELSRLLEEEVLQATLEQACRHSGASFCFYLDSALRLICHREADPVFAETFLASREEFIVRLDTEFFASRPVSPPPPPL